jgi:hypothetical protein
VYLHAQTDTVALADTLSGHRIDSDDNLPHLRLARGKKHKAADACGLSYPVIRTKGRQLSASNPLAAPVRKAVFNARRFGQTAGIDSTSPVPARLDRSRYGEGNYNDRPGTAGRSSLRLSA